MILFDVDATLISTHGVGVLAMQDAGRALYGPRFTVERTEFAGRLDPLIIEDLHRDNGIEPTAAGASRFRRLYRDNLVSRLNASSRARALPGVTPLLSRLQERNGVARGLLTGNFPETGSIKLHACGIDPEIFHIRVWGDESPRSPARREDLPPVAFGRYTEQFGRPVEPESVVVIGDTPYDVRCARANGCRSIGVATGRYNAAALEHAGADLVLPDLSDTRRILDWIGSAP